MKIQTAMQDYLIEIEVRKCTAKTRRWYRTGLNLYLRFCREVLLIEDTEEITIATAKKVVSRIFRKMVCRA